MMKGLRFACALCAGWSGAMLSGTPATAAPTIITSGSFAAGDEISRSGSVLLGPGRYRFDFTLTGAVDYFDGSVTDTRSTNYYCDFEDGQGVVYCGGDDVPINPTLDPVGAGRYEARLMVATSTSFSSPGPGTVRVDTSDSCCLYGFDFNPTTSGDYVFSYTALPEPLTWALMIVGFAGIGAALRRSRIKVSLNHAQQARRDTIFGAISC